jgi:HK97 family phage prohead protease
MSSTETELEQVRTREVLVRTFHVETQEIDDRTIEMRVVPFDEVATVADPPDFKPYEEQFVRGVFAHQENAANRILLRAGEGHDSIDEFGYRKPGLAGVIGHGKQLSNGEDGVYAQFKMHTGPEAETARELVRDGVYTGVSAEFRRSIDRKTQTGIVQRVKADLASVLLTATPAYSKAQVLAMREEVIVIDEEMLPPAPDKELLERCAKLGIALPQSMRSLIEEQVA